MHAQNTRGLAQYALLIGAFVHQLPQAHDRAELHEQLSPLRQYDENLLEKTGRRPVIRKDDLPERVFLVRAPAPEHGNRQQLHVQLRVRSEEHTSELQSLMRISYAVFCLKKKK